jgi:RNA polymerase sigma-70 factor (ECF subfamily)
MQTVGEPRRLDVTRILKEVQSGNSSAIDRLMSVVYSDLRRIVRGVMASEGQHHALQPAAVVNAAFLGLVPSRLRSASFDTAAPVGWQTRAHFLAVAAGQIRLALGDYAQCRRRMKAGWRLTISLDDPFLGNTETTHDFAVIDQLLKSSAATNVGLGRILEMSCFGGMTVREIALVLHTSTTKARRDREFAGRWLARQVSATSLSVSTRETAKGVF